MPAPPATPSLPSDEPPCPRLGRAERSASQSSDAPRRLFATSQSILRTLAEIYLTPRGLDPATIDVGALRFHPHCYYRDSDEAPRRAFPALIAAVTDNAGRLTGIHRTWLDPVSSGDKAPLASPRSALGELLGAGVRFGFATSTAPTVMAAGEGLETVMSPPMAMPAAPVVADLSANHLAALILSASLRRLYPNLRSWRPVLAILREVDRVGSKG